MLPLESSSAEKVRSYPQLSKELTSKTKKGLIGRHVAWLKEPKKGFTKYGKKLLTTLEILALSVSGVGIPVVINGFNESKKLDNYQKLKDLSQKVFSPPEIDNIEKPSKINSFNHVDEYIIHEGNLWAKPRNTLRSEWRLMYYDGYLTGEKPVALSADGANLAVEDKDGNIHYKKILDETRYWFLKDKYSMKDLTNVDNWYDEWFSLPVVSAVYHLFHPKRLALPKDCIGWAMSHRGKYVRHFNDRENRKRPEFAMVTTMWAYTADRKKFRFADPFLWNGFKNEIPGPSEDFEIEDFDVSASTLASIGKQKNK